MTLYAILGFLTLYRRTFIVIDSKLRLMTLVTQNQVMGKEDHMQPFHILFATCCDPNFACTVSASPSSGLLPLEAPFMIAEKAKLIFSFPFLCLT